MRYDTAVVNNGSRFKADQRVNPPNWDISKGERMIPPAGGRKKFDCNIIVQHCLFKSTTPLITKFSNAWDYVS